MATRLKLLVIVAHPDDAELSAGGLMTVYSEAGHQVRIVSVTNGAAGHHLRQPAELAEIRKKEAADAAAVISAEATVWEFPDGSLEPTLEVRRQVIREIRTYQPDLVLTHRCCDYHPDHRAVGQVVQDASYMVTVPLVEPSTPHLSKDPVVAFLPDLFTKPVPLQPDVVLDITATFDTIVSMAACHVSQVFEFLPYNHGRTLPSNPADRITWLREWVEERAGKRATRFRDALNARYGPKGESIQLAEVFEISEYAAKVDEANWQRLFGWLP